MLAQKFFQLISVEIGDDMVPGHKCRNIRLLGQFLHFLVGLSILADVDFEELVAARFQIFLGIDAPRTPFAAVEL